MSCCSRREAYQLGTGIQDRSGRQYRGDVDGGAGSTGSTRTTTVPACDGEPAYRVCDHGALYVSVFESELRVMGGLSADRDEQETGGSLYGAWTHGGRPTIFLVTGPGPKAFHSVAHYRHDLDFFQTTSRIIEHDAGVQHIGDFHWHHRIGLERPSGGDLDQVRAVTSKNHCGRWCGIITTACLGNGSDLPADVARRTLGPALPDVQINAFVYVNPQAGIYVPAAVNILPGISPVRLALLASGKLDPASIGEHGLWFPLARIRHLPAFADGAPSPATNVLATLAGQLQQLPTEVQKQIKLRSSASIITIAAPLTGNRIAYIAVNQAAPHPVLGVHVKFTTEGELQEVGKTVLGKNRELRVDEVYSRLAGAESSGSNPSSQTELPCEEETAGKGEEKNGTKRRPGAKVGLRRLCRRIAKRIGKTKTQRTTVGTPSGNRAKGGRNDAVGS